MKKTWFLSIVMVILGGIFYFAAQSFYSATTAPDRDVWGISISFYPKYRNNIEKAKMLKSLWQITSKLDTEQDTLGTLSTKLNHIIRDTIIDQPTELLQNFYSSPKAEQTHRDFIERYCKKSENSSSCRNRLMLNLPPAFMRKEENKIILDGLEQFEKDIAKDYHSKLRSYEYGQELFWRYFLYQNNLQTETGKNELHFLVSGVIDTREIETEFNKHKSYLESHAESLAQKMQLDAVLKVKFCNARHSTLQALKGKYVGGSYDTKSVSQRHFSINIHINPGDCVIKTIDVTHPAYMHQPIIYITDSKWTGEEPIGALLKSVYYYIFEEQ